MSVTINYETFAEKFAEHFSRLSIDFTNAILHRFYIFAQYLLSENEKYNLTAITDIDDIIIKHYLDSAAVLKYVDIPENSSVVDIGTGAGFPSVPLRIMRKDLNITYLDGSEKKINFINDALNIIKETNKSNNTADMINTGEDIFYRGRAEDAGNNLYFREKYDFAVSRAVAKLNVLCELAAPLIKPGGYFIAYKSKNAAD